MLRFLSYGANIALTSNEKLCIITFYQSCWNGWEGFVHVNRYSLESSEEDYEDAICVNIEGVLKNEKLQGW